MIKRNVKSHRQQQFKYGGSNILKTGGSKIKNHHEINT
jgi:hypothetical protein